jgi:signal transduction histidine kinase
MASTVRPGAPPPGEASASGREQAAGGRVAPRALAVAAGPVLRQVLTGRDVTPGWRSPQARRWALAAGWAGWALVAASVLLAASHGAVSHGSRPVWIAVEIVVGGAIAAAPRWPLLAWRIAWLGVLVTPLIPGQSHADAGKYIILAVATSVAGLRYPRRVLWTMTVLTLIPVWIWTGPDWVYPAVNSGLFAALVVLDLGGRWRRDRRALAAQTERAARQSAVAERETERAEQETARRAVLEERARIAREMHDVVAHRMSLIAVQAETAPFRLAGVEEPVRAEFAALSAAARQALAEMRGLLGVLRDSDPGARPELGPQPRLADLPELIEGTRRAGATVSFSMDGAGALTPGARPVEDIAVPDGVGLCAYRIVQESLSNAGRHAPGAAINVTVEAKHGFVRISVVNEPPTGQPRDNGTGRGHGLAGMRERVALLGGSLQAGPEAGGGFAVRAVLPCGDEPAGLLAVRARGDVGEER